MGLGKNIRDAIASRAAQEIAPGMVVNLGIGIPSLVPDFVMDKELVYFQSENGILGISDSPHADEEDENLCNAGGFPVTLRPGGCYFDSCEAFGMIRSGKIDLSILGALQVSSSGDLANWIVPGKRVPGMGGAMELASGAKKVIVTMNHCDGQGRPKIVANCSLPLTAPKCVHMIITEKAVMTIEKEGLVLREIFTPYCLADVLDTIAAPVIISDDLIIL